MSDDDERPIARWSRLKRRARRGDAAPEAPPAPGATPRGGAAAPVAGRWLPRSLPPLASAEQDADDPYAGPPIVEAHGLPPEPTTTGDAAAAVDETRELTPEEREAVKDLPPIDSLDKDSDYTPFLNAKVPDFIRRKALSVLWRSDPVLANLDGLNDYDEDFSLAAAVAESLADAQAAGKLAKPAKAETGDAAPAAQPTETAEAGDDIGEADGDVEVGQPEAARLPAADADDDDDDDAGADLVRPPGTPPRRH